MTQNGKSFALIGAAGFVAPRHLRAIKDVGGTLKAALDRADAVGVLDSYFPAARFFVEFERFDRHLDRLRRRGDQINFVSICSPNYLHDAHVRFTLRSGADAICEKPLVLNPWNIDGLADIQQSTGRKISTILQLRLHPGIIALKRKLNDGSADRVYDVDLTYITSRGSWYYSSWKGDEQRSGGIATNIGVHFYDMLFFVFGPIQRNIVHHRAIDCAAGYLEYKMARVRWFLSINRRDLPENLPPDQTTFRSITVDGQEVEFSGGFTDLHTRSYEEILRGNGFGLDEARPSIEITSHIRTAEIERDRGERHPFLESATEGQRYRYGWPV